MVLQVLRHDCASARTWLRKCSNMVAQVLEYGCVIAQTYERNFEAGHKPQIFQPNNYSTLLT